MWSHKFAEAANSGWQCESQRGWRRGAEREGAEAEGAATETWARDQRVEISQWCWNWTANTAARCVVNTIDRQRERERRRGREGEIYLYMKWIYGKSAWWQSQWRWLPARVASCLVADEETWFILLSYLGSLLPNWIDLHKFDLCTIVNSTLSISLSLSLSLCFYFEQLAAVIATRSINEFAAFGTQWTLRVV